MEKENNLATVCPGIAGEWNTERNGELRPSQVSPGSNKKVWWKCAAGHEWQAQIVKRTKGDGCPFCSNHRVLMGFNDLQTTDPALASQWHPSKNGELHPSQVTRGTSRKVWWQCSRGHEWEATIGSRASGLGCPYCSNKRVLPGYNDLQTVNPVLSSQWNWEKNAVLRPTAVTGHCGKAVWWICRNGHEWKATVDARSRGLGCPVCSNKEILAGYNDLKTTAPELAKQWHLEKNGSLLPEMVGCGSQRKVWWMCSKGHEWQASIVNRSKGIGCPMCSQHRKTSFPEKAVFYYLRQVFPDAACNVGSNTFPWLGRMSLDVYIPDLSVAVEYDGPQHSLPTDQRKNDLCTQNGVTLIRIRHPQISNELKGAVSIKLRDETHDSLSGAIKCVLSYVAESFGTKFDVDIDIERDRTDIYRLLELQECENSLPSVFPQIAAQWHSVKNAGLRPEMFAPMSNRILWWKCDEGHEWRAAINDRALGSGCPYCANKKVLIGYNDLETTAPELAKEWNLKRNGGLSANGVTGGSRKTVWWFCARGHEWKATVAARSRGGGCPYCSNKRVLAGHNDLSVRNPKLAAQWNYEKNGTLLPEMVVCGSHRKVWWICKNNHQWQASIVSRMKGNGCPYCAGKTLLPGQNDLKTVNPQLAMQWHAEKNGGLTPEMVLHGSHRKVWWQCARGHEWQAVVKSRGAGMGCPYCSNRKTLAGYNDLQTTEPLLAEQWHPNRNGDLHPSDVTRGTNRKVWWQCSRGHEWEASVASRASGVGCPCCSNKKVLPGYNDLQTVDPVLAGQWHSEYNNLYPTEITAHSGKKVWWKCNEGHAWLATVNNRSKGAGCPVCYHERRKNERGKRKA